MPEVPLNSTLPGDLAEPGRPPMDPARGFRRIPMSPHEITAAVTDTKDLFILAHLGIPRVDAAQWSLIVDGLVGRPRTITFDELKALPKKIVEAVHQCCGSPSEPTVPTHRVANVRWGGVDLCALLEELSVHPQAHFLWSYGLDGGDFAGTSCDWFVKDIPLERLAAGDLLIAYELNGEPLSAEHGFPARLVVPGYYGTNSVKWLWRLHLAERRADGPFTTTFYNDPLSAEEVAAGLTSNRPVWCIAPESIIVSPEPDAVLRAGEPIEIWGWAWSFDGVASVRVSVDGGANDRIATLEGRRGWAWQRFSLPWRPASSGQVQLGVRAFATSGLGQPQEGARNAIHTVRITVRDE